MFSGNKFYFPRTKAQLKQIRTASMRHVGARLSIRERSSLMLRSAAKLFEKKELRRSWMMTTLIFSMLMRELS